MKWYDVNAIKMYFCRSQGLTLEQTGDAVGVNLKSVSYHLKTLNEHADKLQLNSFFEENKEKAETTEEKITLSGKLAAKYYEENKILIDNIRSGHTGTDDERPEEKESDPEKIPEEKNSILSRAVTESVKTYYEKDSLNFLDEIDSIKNTEEQKEEKNNFDGLLTLLIPIAVVLIIPTLFENKSVSVSAVPEKKNIDDPLAEYRI